MVAVMTSPSHLTSDAAFDATDLESEIREALAELDRGDCITVSPEQLERCVADGEPPWPDESSG